MLYMCCSYHLHHVFSGTCPRILPVLHAHFVSRSAPNTFLLLFVAPCAALNRSTPHPRLRILFLPPKDVVIIATAGHPRQLNGVPTSATSTPALRCNGCQPLPPPLMPSGAMAARLCSIHVDWPRPEIRSQPTTNKPIRNDVTRSAEHDHADAPARDCTLDVCAHGRREWQGVSNRCIALITLR
jgi:hypothetical protein